MTSNSESAAADNGPLVARIQELLELELADRTSFAEALADNIMDPDPIDTEAFRSEDLIYKSFTATQYLLDRTKEQVARHRRDSERQRASHRFGLRVGQERRLLQLQIDGMRAKHGIVPTAPNPRRRAQQALWNEAMRGGPIPAGRWRELLDIEIERDKQRKRDGKKARRDSRRPTDGSNA